MIRKIVSGGQTGADRAALDWAIANGIEHGGWCPKGRKAEDGPIPVRYELRETESAHYLVRTEKNVMTSDATLIVTMKSDLTGGSLRTANFARRHRKPFLHVHKGEPEPGKKLSDFVKAHHIQTLNVAGPRGSSEPEVGEFVHVVLNGDVGGGNG
jgi:hypothetical protein